MRTNISDIATIILVGLVACTIPTTSSAQTDNQLENENTNTMKSYVSIFEIPATDISRAVNFYQAILGVDIERMDFPGMKMGLFPYDNQIVTGVIMKGEGYEPSADGVTIYLNGGDDLQIILDKVEKNDGKILVPKTPHADESGFFALFLDSEGNKLGLHSPN
ncbi:MAG: VOC family protein [Cyclobacteriaceae bacterium]